MYNRGRAMGDRKGERRGTTVFKGLPEYLKYLFVPDIKLESLAVPDKKAPIPMTGLASALEEFENEPDIPKPTVEKKEVNKEAMKQEAKRIKMQRHMAELEEKKKAYNPYENPNATKKAMNTLFIGNLSYLTTESRLREICENNGPIENIVIVRDHEGNSRGYAFVEFTRPEDLEMAYSHFRLDERELIVDVERGRTVLEWLPARLGGGLGKTRIARPKKDKTHGRHDNNNNMPSHSDYRHDYRRDDYRRDERRRYDHRDYRRDERRSDYRRDDYRRDDYRRDDYRGGDRRDRYRY